VDFFGANTAVVKRNRAYFYEKSLAFAVWIMDRIYVCITTNSLHSVIIDSQHQSIVDMDSLSKNRT
jgi:hypothetical protein